MIRVMSNKEVSFNNGHKQNLQCNACRGIYPKSFIRFIEYGDSHAAWPTCGNCLMQFMIELNNILGTETLLDGSDSRVCDSCTEDYLGQSPRIIQLLKAGKKIAAIKEYRKQAGTHDIDPNDDATYYFDADNIKTGYCKISLLTAKNELDKVEIMLGIRDSNGNLKRR